MLLWPAVGCSQRNAEPAPEPLLAFAGEETVYELPQNAQLVLKYRTAGLASLSLAGPAAGWTLELNEQDSTVTVRAPFLEGDAAASCRLALSGEAADGTVQSAELQLNTFAYDAPGGVFLLNEGNMTTENGSLVYITPQGTAYADVYRISNGSDLGNVCQDLFIGGGEIYVISQNGESSATGAEFENDGKLVVADARTLRRTDAFRNADVAELEWPTHVAVLDPSNVFIRDNRGVWRLDRSTRRLTFVEGTDGAIKGRMARIGDRVYALTNAQKYMPKVLVLSAGNDAAEKVSIWQYNSYSGLCASSDGNLWLAGKYGTGAGHIIGKMDVATQTLSGFGNIDVEPSAGYNSSITACGQTVYFQNNLKIYAYDADQNQVTELADMFDVDQHSNLMYNGICAHPESGDLYVNMLSDYASYDRNTLWVFNFKSGDTAPLRSYSNLSRFPAGVYFTDEFEKGGNE